MQIYEWEHLVVSQNPDKFSDHRFYESGDLMFSICHVTSHDHMLKGLCVFMGGSPSHYAITFHVSWLLVLCKWRHIFNLSRDLTRPWI